jgi:beta-galactosidase
MTTATLVLTGLTDIALWSPDSPKLYTLAATLSYGDVDGSGGSHTVTRNIGFREAVFRPDGFYLNGSEHKIFGLNRHQLFPYTAMAAPGRLQRRDAQILRNELNCTMVRCSHYPQSPHFLDACDELGLMVFQEVPGWHWMGAAAFQQIVLDNVRDMVIRDRSRPSVVLWGTRLNESDSYPGLYARARAIADELDGSRQTTGTMTTQSTDRWAEGVFSYDNYAVKDGLPVLLPPTPHVPYLVTEAVGAGRPTYRWTDSQQVLAQQALAHAIIHDAVQARPRYAGALCWAGIDYWSAARNIKNWNSMRTPGVLDVFRVPKPGAAIYRSQVSPQRRPVIVPAFSWPDAGSDRMIATNCDRLEIYLGGRHHSTVRPDRTRFPGLSYPPAFVNLPGAHHDLVIAGYLGSDNVSTLRMSADTSHDQLSLTADDTEIQADGTDATRITFRATDAYGNHRRGVTGNVRLSLTGPAVLVGQNPFAFGEFGGVGGAFVRSLAGETGTIQVTATHPRLGTARVTLAAASPRYAKFL